jgi:16S rRNA (guanine527-N7)-methyltransferase
MADESVATRLFPDSDELEDMLVEGGRKIGIELDEYQVRQLLSYLALLSKWNTVYNLTAIRSSESMVTHHFLDSLAVAPALKGVGHLLDVGSGAGLPGMVLAIFYPDVPVSLIDAVQKKTAFLSQAKAELHLKNVTVHTGRVEQLRSTEKFDAIISRAFSDLSRFVALSRHLLADNGKFYAMKGILPEGEMAALPAGLKLKAVVPLKVPFLDAERHLLVMEKEEF